MRLFVPFLAAVLLALGSISASAAAQTSTASYQLPLSGTVVNPCNGESVAWNGSAHFVVQQVISSSGHETLSGEVNFQGVQGDGSLGNTYRLINSVTTELNAAGSAANEFTTTAAFRFVSEGSAPNFMAQTTYHMTFDANGTPTAVVVNIETSCQG